MKIARASHIEKWKKKNLLCLVNEAELFVLHPQVSALRINREMVLRLRLQCRKQTTFLIKALCGNEIVVPFLGNEIFRHF